MPRRRPAPAAIAAPLPDPVPSSAPLYVAWTRLGTLRFRWLPAPIHAHRPLTARLEDRPDAPGAPLTLPGRDQWGDIATPGAAARLLAWRWALGEPVRRVEEVGKAMALNATDQNPIKKPTSPTSPLASPLAR